MSNVIDIIYWCDKKRDVEKKWGIEWIYEIKRCLFIIVEYLWLHFFSNNENNINMSKYD